LVASQASSTSTTSLISHSRFVMPAAISLSPFARNARISSG
jgi:hypothetical protein